MIKKLFPSVAGALGVWAFGLIWGAGMDGMGRMNPYLKGDFSNAWTMYWAGIAIVSVIVAIIVWMEA